MNKYEEKITRMQGHLSVHPADWQTVIRLFKLRSELFSWKQKRRKIEMIQQIAKFKKAAQEAR